VPALPCLESCLSFEFCLGTPPQESIPHPTFLLACVLQPHGGHRATLSALVPSSQEFGFTHTKPFSNCNRRDQHQHSQSLYHPTSLFLVEKRPISYDIHHTTLLHPHFSIENPTTPPLLPTTAGESNTHTTSFHSPATSAQQTHHTTHPHASFPHTSPPDTLVPTPHTLARQLCFLYTFHQIQLSQYHTSLPLPIRNLPCHICPRQTLRT